MGFSLSIGISVLPNSVGGWGRLNSSKSAGRLGSRRFDDWEARSTDSLAEGKEDSGGCSAEVSASTGGSDWGSSCSSTGEGSSEDCSMSLPKM